jgi:hypothetical protein
MADFKKCVMLQHPSAGLRDKANVVDAEIGARIRAMQSRKIDRANCIAKSSLWKFSKSRPSTSHPRSRTSFDLHEWQLMGTS